MKSLILVSLICFSVSAFAICDLCKKVDAQVKAWSNANTKDKRGQASKASNALIERLALGIHAGDNTLIVPLVKLLGAIYARDYDPLYSQLFYLDADLKKPEFEKAFVAEMNKLPDVQKRKLAFGLEMYKQGPEKDDPPSEEKQ